jgi:hypothetical protein
MTGSVPVRQNHIDFFFAESLCRCIIGHTEIQVSAKRVCKRYQRLFGCFAPGFLKFDPDIFLFRQPFYHFLSKKR